MDQPSRILIVRPSALGDVCRTVPVLATLRHAFPEATIDWLVQTENLPAIAAHPALSAAVPFPRRRLGRWWRSPAAARELWRWLAGLRRRSYDVVYDCQGLGRSALFTRATGAPRRIGLRDAREFAWVAYTVRHRAAPEAHAVERMMALPIAEGLEPVWDMRLYLNEPDRRWWVERRRALGLGGRRYAVLAPTSRWSSKRWPAAGWSALVGPLLERGYEALVLIGAPGEREQVEAITAGGRDDAVIDLVGATTVGQTMAIVAEAALVIANDSAPLHMAVGFGRPLVGLFGPTDPARVGPWGAAGSIVRADDGAGVNYRDPRIGDEIMKRISVDDVLARVGS